MLDDKRNIFYKPENAPERSYESTASFTKTTDSTIPEIQVIPPDLSYTGQLQVLLENLVTLIDIAPVIPEPLSSIITRLNYVLTSDTIDQIHTAQIEDETIESEEDTSFESTETEMPSVDSVTVPTDEIQTSTTEWNLDDLFPTPSEITIIQNESKSLADMVTNAYNEDRLGIKKEYTAAMYSALQRYMQQMFAVSNETGMPNFSNFLLDYDAKAVSVTDANLKHCHDTITRLQVLIEEECKLFDKTHSADSTLIVMRNLQSAYQQRKKYYTEEYPAENTYLQTESNKLLVNTRQLYDAQYQAAVENTYRHFNSAAKLTNKILIQTAEEAKAKGQLVKNNVDITAKTPEPAAQAISNTAYVVPTITAENDLNNRYGSTTGVGASSNGTGSVSAANLSGSSAAEQIYNFIRKEMGLSPQIACGMLGNFQQENNLSPEDNSGGLGIMQWIGSRRDNCIRLFGDAAFTLAGQLSFVKWEKENDESWAWDEFLSMNNSTPSNAAKNFCEKVERPGAPMVEKRQSYAEGFYKIYNT